MSAIKYLFNYKGDILHFEHVVYPQWSAKTYAVSEQQARNNLRYQARRLLNMNQNSHIELDGKLEKTRFRLL